MQSLGKVFSTTISGIEARGIEVEAQLARAVKRFVIVGLPDGALRESRDRVRCAIENSGFQFPWGEVIVNLAPATIPKSGSSFDFAIALSILAACAEVNQANLSEFLVLGEIALDGSIKSVCGTLAAAMYARSKKKKLLIAPEQAQIAAMLKGVQVYAVSSLVEAVAFINGFIQLEPAVASLENKVAEKIKPDFSDVIGQQRAKRALELVAAGGHNLLMQGPPGSGKSMLAERLPSILPALGLHELIEVSQISTIISSDYNETSFKMLKNRARPFRAPHHTTSTAGLIGGGSSPVPGEISLAHRGVLFLDEFPEFKRDALEALRQPMERGFVLLSRAKLRTYFPARFILLAAMNPCPCGKLGSDKQCICAPNLISRYQARISGPILDRIDLQVWVRAVPVSELSKIELNDNPTEEMSKRVLRARDVQKERFKRSRKLNAFMSNEDIAKYCELSEEGKKILEFACVKFKLSARSFHRIRKLARTIADCEASQEIKSQHISEAISYRLSENEVDF